MLTINLFCLWDFALHLIFLHRFPSDQFKVYIHAHTLSWEPDLWKVTDDLAKIQRTRILCLQSQLAISVEKKCMQAQRDLWSCISTLQCQQEWKVSKTWSKWTKMTAMRLLLAPSGLHWELQLPAVSFWKSRSQANKVNLAPVPTWRAAQLSRSCHSYKGNFECDLLLNLNSNAIMWNELWMNSQKYKLLSCDFCNRTWVKINSTRWCFMEI